MKKISRRIFLKAAGMLMTSGALAACGSSSSSTAVSTSTSAAASVSAEDAIANTSMSDETLVVALMGEPPALTGLNGSTNENSLCVAECFGGTLYENINNEYFPSLASSYDTIDDTHYRFHLREDACYADGTPVTAEDVVYSFQCYYDAGITNASYFNMEETVAEDDHTVVLALASYAPGWLGLISESSLCIFSQAGVEAVGGVAEAERNCPVSCGRYNVTEWRSGEYILLERNENYWDTDYVGYYKYIKFISISDAASRVLAVQSGDANVAYKISTSDYMGLSAVPNAEGVIISDHGVYNLICNCSSEKLKDVKVREALAYATDAESVNSLINMGTGKVAQGLFPESFPYYHEVFEGGHLPFDPDKAKSLLTEAGVTNLTLKLPVIASNQNIATIVQESMRQAGISVEIEVQEQSVYVQTARSGDYDIQVSSTDYACLQPNCFNQWSPSMVGHSIGSIYLPDNAELIDMTERGYSSDEATCAQAFSDVIDYVIGNYCIIGLCTQSKYCAVTAGLSGLVTGTRMSYIDVSYMHA